jgi:hypothetical protein
VRRDVEQTQERGHPQGDAPTIDEGSRHAM